MLELLEPGLFGLILAAFIAGAVDAVVGGGGLIQIPLLCIRVSQRQPFLAPTSAPAWWEQQMQPGAMRGR